MRSSSRVHGHVVGRRQYCRVYRASNYNPNGPVVSSPQCGRKGGGVTIEEDPHVVDAPVVRFYLDDWEDLVGKLRGDLVHGE